MFLVGIGFISGVGKDFFIVIRDAESFLEKMKMFLWTEQCSIMM